MLITVALVAVFSVAFVVAESVGLEDAATWEGWIGSTGGRVGVGVAVIGALIADLLLPVPSSIVMTLSGALLGGPAGFVANVLGSLGGAWLGWGLARTLGRGVFLRWVGEDQQGVEAWFARWGAWARCVGGCVRYLRFWKCEDVTTNRVPARALCPTKSPTHTATKKAPQRS